MDILLEAYSYISFEERCRAMYGILREIIEYAGKHGREIVSTVARAERDTLARGERPAPDDWVGINYAQVGRNAHGGIELSYPIHPLGDPIGIVAWDLPSQRARKVPGRKLTRYRTTHYGRFVPTRSVQRPWAYLIPRSEARIAEHLERHNLRVKKVQRPFEVECEQFVVNGRETTSSKDIADQAPPETLFFGHWERARVRVSRGDFLVAMAQPLAHVAIYLLEPESDDGLVEWGFFPRVRPGQVYSIRRLRQPPESGGWTRRGK
jgi:hypothetical protein